MHNYNFEESAKKLFFLANSIAVKSNYPFITKEILFASTLLLEESPLRKEMLKKNLTADTISAKAISIATLSVNVVTKSDELLKVGNKAYPVSKQIYDLLDETKEIAFKNYNKQSIGITELLNGISQTYPEVYEQITTALPPAKCPEKLKADPKLLNKISLPKNLAGFLTVLNNKYSPDSVCTICGRDKETEQLMRVLMKTTKKNAILVGKPGVGKTALVEKFAWMVSTHNCPKKFRNSVILSLDVTSIIAGTKYRGEAETRFTDLIQYLQDHPDYILFIDEVHLLLGAGACKDGDLDLANALKPMLSRGDTQVIGATTNTEYEKYFKKDPALTRRFENIPVKEPKAHEVFPMIKEKIRQLEETHHVTITRELVDFVILNASCFHFETHNPDRTLDLLDKAMVLAEISERNYVTREDVLENFAIYQGRFDKMKIDIKKALAYHEAGHCVINNFSTELIECKTLALSIMPAEEYDGVHVYEIDDEITPSNNREYYIQLISSFLGGRVSEKTYSHTLTAGASSDLTKATKVAKDMITKYGLDESFTQDRVFLRNSENPMYTDELISKISEHMDIILKEAHQKAEQVLKEHELEVNALVNALLEKGILSSSEITEIFKKCEEERKQQEIIQTLQKTSFLSKIKEFFTKKDNNNTSAQ